MKPFLLTLFCFSLSLHAQEFESLLPDLAVEDEGPASVEAVTEPTLERPPVLETEPDPGEATQNPTDAVQPKVKEEDLPKFDLRSQIDFRRVPAPGGIFRREIVLEDFSDWERTVETLRQLEDPDAEKDIFEKIGTFVWPRKVDRVRWRLLSYLCVKAFHERASIMELSTSSFNPDLCKAVVGDARVGSEVEGKKLSLSGLRSEFLDEYFELGRDGMKQVVADLGDMYQATPSDFFVEDPKFMWDSISELLDSLYSRASANAGEGNINVFEEDQVLAEEAWKEHAGVAVGTPLFGFMAWQTKVLLNNLLFNDMLNSQRRWQMGRFTSPPRMAAVGAIKASRKMRGLPFKEGLPQDYRTGPKAWGPDEHWRIEIHPPKKPLGKVQRKLAFNHALLEREEKARMTQKKGGLCHQVVGVLGKVGNALTLGAKGRRLLTTGAFYGGAGMLWYHGIGMGFSGKEYLDRREWPLVGGGGEEGGGWLLHPKLTLATRQFYTLELLREQYVSQIMDFEKAMDAIRVGQWEEYVQEKVYQAKMASGELNEMEVAEAGGPNKVKASFSVEEKQAMQNILIQVAWEWSVGQGDAMSGKTVMDRHLSYMNYMKDNSLAVQKEYLDDLHSYRVARYGAEKARQMEEKEKGSGEGSDLMGGNMSYTVGAVRAYLNGRPSEGRNLQEAASDFVNMASDPDVGVDGYEFDEPKATTE